MLADPAPAMPIIYATNALLSSKTESTQTRTRACFILCEFIHHSFTLV